MRPELIALDLDGTLLPRSKVLAPAAREAVAALRSAGTTVVLATGKAFHLTSRYAEELGLTGPQVTLDGALVRSHPDGETLRSVAVPAAAAREALDRLRGLSLLPFLVDGDDRLLVHSDLADRVPWLGAYASRIATSPRPFGEARGDPYFLALLGAREEARRGEARIRDAGSNGLEVFQADFFEKDVGILVVRPRTNKGEGLALVAERLGVGRERVAAVGDWRNDARMIGWAGLGVAMADCHPGLLREADVVVPGDSESGALADLLLALAEAAPTPRP